MPCCMDMESVLPILNNSDYFIEPSISELAAREAVDSGYCSRVPDFVVGRKGYGQIKFQGCTDVRWMNLEQIVKFGRNFVSVYDNDTDKPPVDHGLNKPAEVTLTLQLRSFINCANKLRKVSDRQGSCFLSFNPVNGEWKFLVPHFSRFGLDDEEDDMVIDNANAEPTLETRGVAVHSSGPLLSHSLPAHLGLDPQKMQEMRSVMFPIEEDDKEYDNSFHHRKRNSGKELMMEGTPDSTGKNFSHRTPLLGSSSKTMSKIIPSVTRKEPVALLEYNVSPDVSPSRSILMTGQRKGLPVARVTKVEGFKMEEKHETPLAGGYSRNIVDAALFMGRSFRIGWGPNGILVHSGTPVGSPKQGLSSIIHMEKVSMDKAFRDERNKVQEELVDLCISSSLNLHMSFDHEFKDLDLGSCGLKLQKVVCNRTNLSEVCRAYINIIEKQIELTGLSTSSRIHLMHQVAVWELIKVLFSEREAIGDSKNLIEDDGEEMMLDTKDGPLDIDIEAKPFVRRAAFSYWLQDCVCHRVQDEVSCLNDSSYLEQILLLLTGRQLDAAVELAASRGDVRLAVLLGQAGGSMVNRHDMAQQLNLWKMNGLDFKFIENDRLKLYELLAGNIQGALQDSSVDWKRYLGLVMWYQLPPDTSLSSIIHTYHQLLGEGKAPHPVPIYIDEGPFEEPANWTVGDRYDMTFYLMLLHANEMKNFNLLKTMFSAFSSTHDPLNYHMIWHQRSILESIGAFNSNDLHLLDMSFVSQLLCLGQCHWAIYVVLHMPYSDGFKHIQANIIKEILCQYCESWSKNDLQRRFIEELGIPSEWIHEALAVFFEYNGDFLEALEHFLRCYNWQKAHSIFMTSVAHYLFLSSKDQEIWRLTSSMEEHKSEIADWDLGAGVYIDFYCLRSSLQDEDVINELDPLGKRSEACRNFFNRLNDSLLVWGSRLPIYARATFSKMSEELCSLLMSTPGENSSPSVKMGCFEAMLSPPAPEDIRSNHLQNALSVFTYLLSDAPA